MGEMVLNKDYSPEFVPPKMPRRRQLKNQWIKVRIMLPMCIKCNTCGTYIYEGTGFNSRKEDVIGETYLGIQIFRYYFKCTKCSAEITMKTDPQNLDYVVESGAVHNFDPWRDEEELQVLILEREKVRRQATEREKIRREAEEMRDAMKSLENRAMDSKPDMDILAALKEMKSMKSRHATASDEDMLAALKHSSYEKGKSTPGLPSGAGKPTDTLTKASIFNSSENAVHKGTSTCS